MSIVILAGVLAGCGNQTQQEFVAKPAGSVEKLGKDAAFPRIYTDAKGREIFIAKQPERIAIIFFNLVDSMFMLNTPPVAATQMQGFLSEWESLKPYLAVNPVIDLGRQTSANLEKVLEVQPDLIIGGILNEGIYNELSMIAPVVLLDTRELARDWRNVPREVAKVIGQEQTAEQRIIEIESLIEQSRAKLAPCKTETVAVITLDDKGNFYIYGTQSLPAFFDAESGLGLAVPAGYPVNVGRISLERLAELNPDHIFLKKNKGIEIRRERLGDNSIWNALKAVKQGNVYFLDQSFFTVGALAVQCGVNSIVESLTK
ncbi:ABC transporter substrate-binding protein [Sporomusa termitida]|uniref:ABC transporter substrate-binding protein n=1 Tax=Sporomusa termitida TaxID=2377 RepID=UPI001FE2FCF2|nr:ABC transporter substrate-binding protein [Sporomusa termitida]